MIQKLAKIFALSMLFAPSAYAVTVRSGEHGDFTRLVFSIGSNDWSVSEIETGNGIVVSVPDAASDFDVSRVFDRIGRARVADTSKGSDGLRINFACECRFDVFEVGGGFLVIDVKENVPGQEVSEEETDAVQDASSPIMELDDQQLVLRESLTRPVLSPIPQIGPLAPVNNLVPSIANIVQNSEQLDDAPRSTEISQLGAQIAESIAVAATNGTLDASSRDLKNGTNASPKIEVMTKDEPPGENSIIETATNALTSINPNSGIITIGDRLCSPASYFDFATWAENEPEQGLVSLFGEFDRVEDDQVRALALGYLAKGFGAEARNLLSMLGSASSETTALTYAVDGERDPQKAFSDQSDCNGPSAFWALASGSFDENDAINRNAVLQHFETLPKEMREHLGPLIAERVLEKGHEELALALARRLERMAGQSTAAASLVRAEVQLAEGKAEQAIDDLKELARQPGPEAHRAVAASVEAARVSGRSVPDDIAELAEAFSQEMKQQEDGGSLWRAHVVSLLQQDNFAAALEAYSVNEGVGESTLEKTSRDLASDIISDATDFLFINTSISGDIPKSALRESRIGEAYIERLIGLGLYDFALSEIRDLDLEGKTNDLKLLMATALMKTGRFFEAYSHLENSTEKEAKKIKAEAKMKLGEYATAAMLFKEIGDLEAMHEASWMAENWSEISEISDIRLSAATLFSEYRDSFDIEIPSLNVSENLAEESAETRNTVEALLEELSISE